MTQDELRAALRDARQTLAAADDIANDLAAILRGRLRRVGSYNLKELKKELRAFNAHTGRWS